MAFSLTKFIKGLRIAQENTLTPAAIEILPAGTASTTTTVVSSQTADRTVTLPDLSGTALLNSSVINAIQIGAGAVDNTEFGYLDGVTSPIQNQLNGIAGSAITALTGDVVATGPGSVAATIQSNAVTTSKINAGAVTDAKVASGIDAVKLADGSVSNTEFQYLDGVTSAIQTQLDAKQPTITTLPIAQGGTNSSAALTGNKAIISNGSQIVESAVTSTELSRLSGVTSAVQTQLDGKVSFAGVEVLTNKDIDGGTASNTSRITIPKAAKTTLDGLTRKAGTILFDTTSSKPYYDDGTTLKVVGSGSSAGAKNYIPNADFEDGNINGWTLGTTGTLTNGIPTGTPTFGSGASANLSLSLVSSGQLAGLHSLGLTSSTASVAGNMFATDALPIDIADQAKVLTMTFSYKVSSGAANGNFSGTLNNSFGIACYDVTNSSYLPVIGNFAMTQSSGSGTAVATLQTNANTASVRFIVYNVTATSGAISLEFDRFYLGPQTIAIGSIITDWQPYTPSFGGMGTVAMVNVIYRRVGANVEIKGDFVTGSTNAGVASIYLPSGLVASSTTFNPNHVGVAVVDVAGNDAIYLICRPSDPRLFLSVQNASYYGLQTPGASSFLGNASHISFNATVPIAGWSSNVQMSSDTDTRVISFSGSNPGQAITAGTDIPFTASTDRAGAWNGTQYVVPVAGDYFVSCNIGNSVANTPSAFVNGVQTLGNYFSTSTAGQQSAGSVLLTALKPGDLISVRTNASGTLSNGVLYINRLSGPAVVASSETIAASIGLTTNQAVASLGVIKYDTVALDTHAGYSAATGLYTVPATGNYRISVLALASVGTASIFVEINAVAKSYLAGIGTAGTFGSGSVVLPVLAGQTIGLYVNGAVTLTGDVTFQNIVSIERIK